MYGRNETPVCITPACQRPEGCRASNHMFNTAGCAIHRECQKFRPGEKTDMEEYFHWEGALARLKGRQVYWDNLLNEAKGKLSKQDQVELAELLDKAIGAMTKAMAILNDRGVRHPAISRGTAQMTLPEMPRKTWEEVNAKRRNERDVKRKTAVDKALERKEEPIRVDEHGRAVPSLEDIR